MFKNNTLHEDFIEKLEKINKEALSQITFIEQYKGRGHKILARDKFGLVYANPNSLLTGGLTNLNSAVNKHDYFLSLLKLKNELAYKELIFLEEYKTSRERIRAKYKYGEVLVSPNSLLNGGLCDIRSAVNKTEFFLNNLMEVNPNCFKEIIRINVGFKSNSTFMYFETKYGECRMTPNAMLSGKSHRVESAVNKTEYCILKSISIHGDIYDYSLTKYNGVKPKQKIICLKHGIFYKDFSQHIMGQGCPECAKDNGVCNYYKRNIERNRKDNKNKTCYVYLMRFNNFKNVFYKIGVSIDINRRKRELKTQSGYNVEVIKNIKTNIYDATHLEGTLHRANSKNKFVPDVIFAGYTECFSSINDECMKMFTDDRRGGVENNEHNV